MTDKDIIEKINIALRKTDNFFTSVDIVPESYKQMAHSNNGHDEFYYRNLWLHDKNHKIKPNQNMFSFNADEIEQYKIPSYVVGCSGRADMFAKYAQEIGLSDIFIIPCVKIENKGHQLSGHQIVAVKMSNGLQLLNPAGGVKNFNRAKIDFECKIGNKIDAMQHGTNDYIISAILTPKEHAQIDSYEKLKKIYNRVFIKRIFNNASIKIKNLFNIQKQFGGHEQI